jgi:hypothetical protein
MNSFENKNSAQMIPCGMIASKKYCGIIANLPSSLRHRIMTPYAGIIQIRLEGSGPADPISAVFINSTPDVQLLRMYSSEYGDIIPHFADFVK